MQSSRLGNVQSSQLGLPFRPRELCSSCCCTSQFLGPPTQSNLCHAPVPLMTGQLIYTGGAEGSFSFRIPFSSVLIAQCMTVAQKMFI